MELQNYYNKFIISGGPGFGKTTLLKKLEEREYIVFYEAAIAVIQEQKKSNKPIFPWDNRVAFDHELIKKMRVDYQQAKSNFGVADFGYELFYLQFLKPRFKLTFGYMQNWHSYLDSATPKFL